jgi:hypothetical protein
MSRNFPSDPGFFPENEERSTMFMKIGQSKLSENFQKMMKVAKTMRNFPDRPREEKGALPTRLNNSL